jgi:hypothetical protein
MNTHGFWERIVAYEIQEYENQNLYENWQMSHATFIIRHWRIDPLESVIVITYRVYNSALVGSDIIYWYFAGNNSLDSLFHSSVGTGLVLQYVFIKKITDNIDHHHDPGTASI